MKTDLKEADSTALLVVEPNDDTINNHSAEQAREEQIRIRAYEIYLARENDEGSDVEDWLRAEIECFGS